MTDLHSEPGNLLADAHDRGALVGNAVRYDRRILGAMRRIIRSFDVYSKQLEVLYRITTPQLVCLLAVVERGPLTATAIAREVHLSTSTLVGILDRLEEKGLIRRERGREDRRTVAVLATEAGCAVARQAPSPLQRTLAEALTRLPELEQAPIALALERIVNLMGAPLLEAPSVIDEPAHPGLGVLTDPGERSEVGADRVAAEAAETHGLEAEAEAPSEASDRPA